MPEETVSLKGNLHIVVRDEHGNIKEERQEKNLVVSAGLSHIAARLAESSSPTRMSHMAIGTGTTAAASGDTVLGNGTTDEKGRVALTSFGASGAVATAVATFGAGTGTGAITEAGIFNSASANAGTMLCRTVFAVVNKGASDSMTITWTITVS